MNTGIKSFLVVIFAALIVSCATGGMNKIAPEGYAEVVITRVDALKRTATVYVDGQSAKINAGETVKVIVPNGNHGLDISYAKFKSERVDFTTDSDRTDIRVEVKLENPKPAVYSISVSREGTTTKAIGGNDLEAAVHRAYNDITKQMPEQSRIAIINISASNARDGEFVLEEFTNLLVNSKRYSIVDRQSLDSIRAEMNFQLSGDVDDNSAVDIGKMLGAEIVITGNITDKLRVRALGVQTAQIIAMTTQTFSKITNTFNKVFGNL
jgi:predicted nucleic acid-binding protein